jgi:membrane-associated phospholipid phosphatase
MKPWERVVFGLTALTVLAAVGVKLHELDMPVARFVRSFDIDALNLLGDLVALPGNGVVVTVAFILIGLLGWWQQRHQLRPVTFSMAGLGQWATDWWRQRNRLTDIGARGLFAQVGISAVVQLLKHIIGRPRPRFAHSDAFSLGPSLATGFDSFPSGHAANAFGAAAVLAWFFPAVRIPLYLVAGLVALSRVLRGSHFLTDVLVGAAVGVVIGSMVVVGLKRWPKDALPGLLRTGTPVAVSTFSILWVVLHPAAGRSYEVISLGVGVALVLAGGLVRGLSWTYLEGEDKGPLRAVGRLLLIIGVAVGCAPWWAAVLLGAALVPLGVAGFRQAGAPATLRVRAWAEVPVWGREALAVGAALVVLAALQSVKGLIPLG